MIKLEEINKKTLTLNDCQYLYTKGIVTVCNNGFATEFKSFQQAIEKFKKGEELI